MMNIPESHIRSRLIVVCHNPDICLKMTSFTLFDTVLPVCFGWIVTGATWSAGNAHSFRNTWFHSLWGVHDFTPGISPIHYIYITNLFSLGTMFTTGLFAWIRLTALSRDLFYLYDIVSVEQHIVQNIIGCGWSSSPDLIHHYEHKSKLNNWYFKVILMCIFLFIYYKTSINMQGVIHILTWITIETVLFQAHIEYTFDWFIIANREYSA